MAQIKRPLSLSDKLLLYAVTSAAWVGRYSLAEQVEQAILGGATLIQLREKELNFNDYLTRAKKVKEVCDKYDVDLIIDDSVEVALACDASGVHIGQEDVAVDEARKALGDLKIIGVSAKTVEQAMRAEKEGADYLGVGAIYPTQTKKNPIRTSLETLQAICRSVAIPVVGIGGIKLENMSALRNSGVVGVSIVSAIFGADDIIESTRALRKEAESLFTS